MSIQCKITILRARVLEKTKHVLYYAHHCNPTRSIKENKKRKREAMDAATAEKVATLERALKEASRTRSARKKASRTTNIDTGPVSCTCCRFSGLG